PRRQPRGRPLPAWAPRLPRSSPRALPVAHGRGAGVEGAGQLVQQRTGSGGCEAVVADLGAQSPDANGCAPDSTNRIGRVRVREDVLKGLLAHRLVSGRGRTAA